MNKRAELLSLAKRRQAARWRGYNCIGDYHGGAYECDFVSPYTRTAGNIDAKVMVLLQDWSSDGSLSGPFDEDSATLGYSRHVETNINLIRLLHEHFGLTLPDVYGTNLFPFIKLGPMNAPISQRDLIKAASEFALPQIRIVNPKLVICLGCKTFDALRRACDLIPCGTLSVAINDPFDLPGALTRVWCQAHTGRLGRNNRNKGEVDRVSDDWNKMKTDLENRFGRPAADERRAVQPAHAASAKTIVATSRPDAELERAPGPHSLVAKRTSERQKPCRVIVLSHGQVIHSTPTRHSRPDLNKEIISFQRRWLQKRYPALKNMPEAVYKLQWLEGDDLRLDLGTSINP